MSLTKPAVSTEQFALFAALRSGQPLPADVAWALTDLLTQVAVTVREAETRPFESAGAARGWLDVLGRSEHTLITEWKRSGG